jgi:hypothetical protein
MSDNLLSRRQMLRLSAAAAAALKLAPAALAAGSTAAAHQAAHTAINVDLSAYTTLLRTWCDGLVAHQVTSIKDPTLYGAFLCPACGLVHGRVGDAFYPLLAAADIFKQEKYLHAALLVHQWSERNMTRADGSWNNDITLSEWRGITVFRTIALCEALEHHGSLLPAKTRGELQQRIATAANFLDGFITMDAGVINYPTTSTLAFTLAGQVLNNQHYLDHAREIAHTVLDKYFTPNHLLFGEGHPQTGSSPHRCRAVDLGYNVEESLPALAMYALLQKDDAALDRVTDALAAHLEFMLPDGGWDNSWGTRIYKWTWWGSRTSDGCQPAYVLLSDRRPVFAEAARRNLALMAACTHNGLLYGGPDYFSHGDNACIHHTFTHAKALATVLDRGRAHLQPKPDHLLLPRETARGLKAYPEIGTYLAAIGEWRATVTQYDWLFEENIQTSATPHANGGHPSGGALSLLYHRTLGPVLTSSMTQYAALEIANQQAFTEKPHSTLTPRVEFRPAHGPVATSLSDYKAEVTPHDSDTTIVVETKGQMLTNEQTPLATLIYKLRYLFTESALVITAEADAPKPPEGALSYILPVICRPGDTIAQTGPGAFELRRPTGTLKVVTDAPHGFLPMPPALTFNLVPGWQCLPLAVALTPGVAINIALSTG